MTDMTLSRTGGFACLAVACATLAALSCGSKSTCVTGESKACACVNGTMGAQICQADGTYAACQCGSALCNASNCTGCCDAVGACQAGTASTACGSSGSQCIACGGSQQCTLGVCTTPGGTGGGSGGGGGSMCSPSNCNGCCDSTGACRLPTAMSTQCGSNGEACVACKRIFVTNAQYDGNLGGLAGADQKCSTAAQAAGLGGTWKAWLSDANTNAIDRITANGPWYLRDNDSRVFNNKANLMTNPLTPIRRDENDGTVNGFNTWTGTRVGGTRSTHCASWSSSAAAEFGQAGSTLSNTNSWTEESAAIRCSEQHHLYCLEQ